MTEYFYTEFNDLRKQLVVDAYNIIDDFNPEKNKDLICQLF
jgi:hypothetical protein